jgi:hypothetical protein
VILDLNHLMLIADCDCDPLTTPTGQRVFL